MQEHLNKHNASDEQRAKARERMLKINEDKDMGIEVFDTVAGLTAVYSSILQAALAIGCSHSGVRLSGKTSVNKGVETLLKIRYIVKKKIV